MLEVIRKNIGCIRPEIRTEIIPGRANDQLIHIVGKLLFTGSPREIGIRLSKTNFAKRCHDFRSRKSLSQKYNIRILFIYFMYSPFPERNGFSVRIIHSENFNTLVNPIGDDRFQFMPQRLPVFRFKIKGINILIFFWWILRVLNRSIGTLFKPLEDALSHKDDREHIETRYQVPNQYHISSLLISVFYNRQRFQVRAKCPYVLHHHSQ